MSICVVSEASGRRLQNMGARRDHLREAGCCEHEADTGGCRDSGNREGCVAQVGHSDQEKNEAGREKQGANEVLWSASVNSFRLSVFWRVRGISGLAEWERNGTHEILELLPSCPVILHFKASA